MYSTMTISMRRVAFIAFLCLGVIAKANGECAKCASGTCLPNQTCNGCKEGFYGLKCQQSCSHLCLSCVQDFDVNKVCLTCKPGWYGPTCQHKCRIGCATCTGEYRCQICEPGYEAPGAQTQCTCANNCEDCKTNATVGSHYTCARCRLGYYGISCENRCPLHCIFCSSNTSCVICPSGYSGQLCDIKCLPHCSLCHSSGSCRVCEPGRFSSHNMETGTTMECQSRCSSGCRDKACEKWSGRCDCKSNYFIDEQCSICVLGKYGEDCKLNCSTDCLNGGCRRSDGRCNSCSKGRYGDKCERACRDTCVDRECDRDGRCTYGCEKGFYGQLCQLKCSTGCKDSICSRNKGVCWHDCMKGVSSDFCETGQEKNSVLLYVLVTLVVIAFVLLVVKAILILIVRCRKARPKTLGEFDTTADTVLQRRNTPVNVEETREHEHNTMSRTAISEDYYTQVDE